MHERVRRQPCASREGESLESLAAREHPERLVVHLLLERTEVEATDEGGVGERLLLLRAREDDEHPVEGREVGEGRLVPEQLNAALAPRLADEECGGEGGGREEAEDVEEDLVREGRRGDDWRSRLLAPVRERERQRRRRVDRR